MDSKYTNYFLASVVMLALAGGIYFYTSNRSLQVENLPKETIAQQVNMSESPNNNDTTQPTTNNPLTEQYNENLLTQATPESANRYVITEGTASYVVNKKYFNRPASFVTGNNTKLNGFGWFDDTTKAGALYVQFSYSDFASDSPQRDKDIAGLVNTNDIMVMANFSNLNVSPGQPTKVKVPVEVIINGQSKTVEFDTEVTVNEDELMATGTSKVKLSEFGVKTPGLLNVFSVDDSADFNFTVKADTIE